LAAAALAASAFAVSPALSASSRPSPHHQGVLAWYKSLRMPLPSPRTGSFRWPGSGLKRAGPLGVSAPARAVQRRAQSGAQVDLLEHHDDWPLEPTVLQASPIGCEHLRGGEHGRVSPSFINRMRSIQLQRARNAVRRLGHICDHTDRRDLEPQPAQALFQLNPVSHDAKESLCPFSIRLLRR